MKEYAEIYQTNASQREDEGMGFFTQLRLDPQKPFKSSKGYFTFVRSLVIKTVVNNYGTRISHGLTK